MVTLERPDLMNKPFSSPSLNALDRPETLTERVCVELRKALIDGSFKPGELIKIRDVATALNVSPTPAREALSILIAEGTLLAGLNKSAMVPHLTPESLQEITELRVALEGVAAEAATRRLSDKDIAEISRLHEGLIEATDAGDVALTLEKNADFHFALYAHSDMPLVTKMIETTWLRSGAYLRLAYPGYGMLRKGLDNHNHIIDNLRKRDSAAVKLSIEQDIRESSTYLMEILQRHVQASAQ